MKAVSLFGVLLAAHILMAAGRTLDYSPEALLAYMRHDLLVALLFAAADAAFGRSRAMWAAYGCLVGYIALNVPIARALSSPLTWTMARAAGGPLRDSVAHYLTVPNLAAAALVMAAGAALPWILSRLERAPYRLAAAAAAALFAAGAWAAPRVDTNGIHRNAITALWPSRLTGTASPGDGSLASPFGSPNAGELLSRYRGAAAGRNVVLIVLESTAARYLPLYDPEGYSEGGPRVDPMPNLSALAGHAIVFDRAYAVYPESIKGLFAVLFSRFPRFGASAESLAEDRSASVAGVLAGAGYRTAMFHSGRFIYLGMEAVIRGRGFHTLEDAGDIGGNFESSFGVDDGATVQRLLAWIDSGDPKRPFFAAYLPVSGHHPYATSMPGPFPDDTDLNLYRNALFEGDRYLGELLGGLRDRGLDRRTLFVVFGDHGEAFGQHDGNYGHALFLYDENVRIPYLVAAPGLIEEAFRSKRTASVLDTAPTILDLLGIPSPRSFQGASLLDPSDRMAFFFTDYSLGFFGLYDACWKYILETASKRGKLFDVCRDPGESRDAATAEPDRARAYRDYLSRWSGTDDPLD